MSKRNLLNIYGRRSAFQIGKVTAVDSEGVTVRRKGSDKTIKIPKSAGLLPGVGDSITIGQYNGDPNLPAVINYGGYYGSDAAV